MNNLNIKDGKIEIYFTGNFCFFDEGFYLLSIFIGVLKKVEVFILIQYLQYSHNSDLEKEISLFYEKEFSF